MAEPRDLSDISSSRSINSSASAATVRNTGLQRDITAYRFKYLFGQSCSVFLKSVLSRIPSGKKVYLILLMLGLEQLAYTAASDYLIYPYLIKVGVSAKYQSLTRSIVIYIAADLLFPVAGWIADAWVGQYKMIHFSLWILWLGYASLAIIYSVSELVVDQWTLHFIPFLFAVISFGHAGFQACAIPFGANLIRYRTSQELSSYFYCYYWIRNFGLTLYTLSTTCSSLDKSQQADVFVMTSVFCITLILILNGCFKSLFVMDNERINPYKKVIQVLYLALVIKRPVYRSAFSFTGATPPSRLNLTKKVHGGKFSNEEVEDVKTFLRLLLVLVFILCFLIVYTGVTQALPYQIHDMDSKHFSHMHFRAGFLGECELTTDKVTLASNVLFILVLIPIINSAIFPFLREYMPNMLKRIGTGSILTVLAQLCILIISGAGHRREWVNSSLKDQCMFSANFSCPSVRDHYDYSQVSEEYVILPHLLISLAEVFINITSLEFFYAQSPHKMRGMMIGLFFFVWGVASAVTQVIITLFSIGKSNSLMTCDFWYYLFYLFVAVVGCVGYIVIALKYKNRQRGEGNSDIFYRQQ